MREMTFLVPENLNVDEIIGKNKAVFYGNNLKKEKLLYVCDALLRSRAMNRKEMLDNDTSFAPLSSARMKTVIYDYDDYFDFLLKHEIWLTDNHFILGEKCKGYKFNTPYSGVRNKEVKLEISYTFKKAIRVDAEERKQEQKKSMKKYGAFVQWWDTGKLKIDQEAAFDWLDYYEGQKIDKINLNKKLKDKQQAIGRAIEITEDFKQMVKQVNKPCPRYAFAGHAHRFYNPITTLKRELRSFLTYDGQTLVDVDIKNSQPFFSTALMDKAFWRKTVDSKPKLSLKRISKILYESIKSKVQYNDISTLLKTSVSFASKGFSFNKYIDLVVKGEFYEYIQKHFQKLYPHRFKDRQKVKTQVLRIMYTNNDWLRHDWHEPSWTFQEHFPQVFELFKVIKSKQYNLLALILQRIESFLVIDVICKVIGKKHPNVPLFTIHDNIITTKGNEGIVKAIMEEEIEKAIGQKPQIDSKELVPLKFPVVPLVFKLLNGIINKRLELVF